MLTGPDKSFATVRALSKPVRIEPIELADKSDDRKAKCAKAPRPHFKTLLQSATAEKRISRYIKIHLMLYLLRPIATYFVKPNGF